MDKKKVLFLCTHNSARSQMAEAIMRHYLGDYYEAYSAGTKPGKVNPYTIKVLEEIGINTSGLYSKSVEEFVGWEFDYVITVCDSAKEECPFFPGKVVMHKSFPDPSSYEGSEEEKLNFFRRVRDEIRSWILETFGKEAKDSSS